MKLFVLFVLAIVGSLALAEEGSTPVSMTGKYELSSSENFSEFMVALGVGFFTRTMAAAATPISTISKDADDEWTIKTETTFKTTCIKFKFGQEFDETTGDDRECKSTITLEGTTKMLTKQICDGKEYKIEREFSATEMKMILYAPGVVCTRIYRRL